MKTRIALLKRTAIITAAAIVALQFGIAGEPVKKYPTTEKKVEYAVKNLLIAVRTGNTGAIESAMRITAQMKMKYPSADVTALKEVFDSLVAAHPLSGLRYKAYIASAICTDTEWFAQDVQTLNAGEETFFQAASERLHQKLFSTNSL